MIIAQVVVGITATADRVITCRISFITYLILVTDYLLSEEKTSVLVTLCKQQIISGNIFFGLIQAFHFSTNLTTLENVSETRSLLSIL